MFDDLYQRHRQTFLSGRTREPAWRREQLLALDELIRHHEKHLAEALYADFAKSPFESWLTETSFLRNEIKHALRHLKRWMKPRRVWTPLALQPGRSEIVYEPLGTSLIIAPWNYPVQLVLSPLIPALAAGNCAVLKPSELTPKVAELLGELVPRHLDQSAIEVVQGGVEVNQALLEQPWDHVFFTGSTRVGKIVMTAAAKHLSRVTLELGGKSPCLVTKQADLDVAARRIVWGKFVNAGQSCVAPDYLLVTPDVEEPLLARMAAAITQFYGGDPSRSSLYPRIVNDSHFARVSAFLADGDIVCGGQADAANRYIAPTILRDVSPDAPVMQEEIFGPVLPVLRIPDLQAAIDFVNTRPQPLAQYVFGSQEEADQVIAQTRAGGGCVNETLGHLGVPQLPFGGVGPSGMGAYHGHAGFLAFSHARGVLRRGFHFDLSLRYPPYGRVKEHILRLLV